MKKFAAAATAALLATSLLTGTALAAGPKPQDPTYVLSPEVTQVYTNLMSDQAIQKGLQFIQADHDNTVQEQIAITEIPAPPFKEEVRAEDYKKRLQELGLQDVKIDAEGNAYGVRPGTGDGPTLFVSAHLDTVFPEGTDTTVTEKDGKLYAPGISDDVRGLAALLSIVRAFNETNVQTKGDIIFGGTVGEEGLGDLRGVKAFFKEHPEVDGFISIESGSPARITYLATGSHRYSVTYKGPGGHSFGAFGLPSAIHALGRAISDIGDLKTPTEPKTTFTVGTVSGGTSVNSIAAEANMQIDMRSNSEEELLKIEEKVLKVVNKAAGEENKRWKVADEKGVKAEIELIGDRPAGTQPADALNVQAAWASAEAIGVEPQLSGPSSTDSNLPISLGIPSLTLGGGGISGGSHSPGEWFDPTDAYQGPQRVFLTILGLVGVEGKTEPLLVDRK